MSRSRSILGTVRRLASVVGSRSGAGSILYTDRFRGLSFGTGPGLGALNPELGKSVNGMVGTLGRNSNGRVGTSLRTGKDVAIRNRRLSGSSMLFSSRLPSSFISSRFRNKGMFMGAGIALRVGRRTVTHRLVEEVRSVEGSLSLSIRTGVGISIRASRRFGRLVMPRSRIVSRRIETGDLVVYADRRYDGSSGSCAGR